MPKRDEEKCMKKTHSYKLMLPLTPEQADKLKRIAKGDGKTRRGWLRERIEEAIAPPA